MSAIPGIPTAILVAPDSFKGTLSADEVAEAIGAGLRAGGREVDLCPVADGGEGTLAALVHGLDGEVLSARVSDPLGRPIEASFGFVRDRAVAIVETAAASGLHLVSPEERDAWEAGTAGTGELIMAAVAAGARTVLVGVGGSATTDGGAGAVRAIQAGGGLGGARLVVLCDVRTAFEDAARVFGAQKGADAPMVGRLSRRLGSLAGRMARDPRGVPMTGAAGGLSGGLWAAFDAELVAGAAFVLDAVDFDPRMRAARAVITGEGRIDQQSLAGKVVSEVATRARQSGVPCYAVVGRRELDAFGARVLDLQAILEAGTPAELEAAGRRLAEVVRLRVADCSSHARRVARKVWADMRERVDGELLAAAAGGDGAAYAAFYRRHLPGVLALLVRATGDREVAADLAAEVFAAAFLHARRFRARGEGSAWPWLRGIAQNKLRESRRRGRVEDRARRRLGFEPVTLDDRDLARVDELAGEAVALFEALPEGQREAVRSRVLDEREYADIARELACSELVVRQRVSRGLSTLREQMKERER